MKKNLILIITALILLIFLAIFFVKNGKEQLIIEPEQELTEEEKAIQHFLSLVEGKVLSVTENGFVMEVSVVPENFDPEQELEKKEIKVNVTDQTEFVDHNDIKFVEIPLEHQEGLATFSYIKNLTDKEYIISVFVETQEEFNKKSIEENQEIIAKYISWSCYPEDFME